MAPVAPPPPTEFTEEISTREFPIGESGEKLVANVAQMRAIRSLGVIKDDAKKDYELVDTTKTISMVMSDGAKMHGRRHKIGYSPQPWFAG